MNEYAVLCLQRDGVESWHDSAVEAIAAAERYSREEPTSTFRAVETRDGYFVSLTGESLYVSQS